MSRPMALALVLLVLFLTSQSEWRASTIAGPRGGLSDASAAMSKELRLQMHRDGVKEKIILDLIADIKHLEAENRKLREERLLLRQQLHQLHHALASTGASGLSTEYLRFSAPAGTSPAHAEAAAGSATASASASTSAKSTIDSTSTATVQKVLDSVVWPPVLHNLQRMERVSENYAGTSLRSGNAATSLGSRRSGLQSSSKEEDRTPAKEKSTLPGRVLHEPETDPEVRPQVLSPAEDSGNNEGATASIRTGSWVSSFTSQATSQSPAATMVLPSGMSSKHERSVEESGTTVPGVKTHFDSSNAPLLHEEKSKKLREQAVNKLFRGRSGSLGSHRDIGSFTLMAAELQDGSHPVSSKRMRTKYRHKRRPADNRPVTTFKDEASPQGAAQEIN